MGFLKTGAALMLCRGQPQQTVEIPDPMKEPLAAGLKQMALLLPAAGM